MNDVKRAHLLRECVEDALLKDPCVLTCQKLLGGDYTLVVKINALNVSGTESSGSKHRQARAATNIEDMVRRAQARKSEESSVLVRGYPTALAKVFAVGIAPHLLQNVRGEVTVGRPVKIHGFRHVFPRILAG